MSKEDNKEEAPEQEQSIWRSLGGTLLYLLVIVLLTWVIVTFVGQRTKVDGHSMEPTLSDGDNLIVDKLSYRFRDPERYDIIAVSYTHLDVYKRQAIASPSATAAEEKNDPYAGRHSAATSTVIHRISTSAVCCT